VSLWFGRNEEGGLRCPYHGWKYDYTGQCVEVPSEPAESGFCNKIKLKSYPLVAGGGILWAYLGAPQNLPKPPAFEWTALPASHRYVSKRWQESNYLQAMEGGLDSSHVSFLHSGELETDPLHRGTAGARYLADHDPKFEVIESAGGLAIGARRNAGAAGYYWRISQWIMPWYTMVPPYADNALNAHAFVPIDDENCLVWTFTYHPTRPLSATEREVMGNGGGIHTVLIPGTFRPVVNKHNDYMIDRNAQKVGRSYSGVAGIAMQDASIQESMGPVVDRTKENLVSTDNAIIMARHRLLRAALALEQHGTPPPALAPECQEVRSASFVLPRDLPFGQAKREDLTVRQGIAHTSV
jgi:phthalate 4,5-dioxygenase